MFPICACLIGAEGGFFFSFEGDKCDEWKWERGKKGTDQVRETGHVRARDRPESLRTFIQGQWGRRVDFRGAQLTRESCVGSDGHRSVVSFAAFVEDGNRGNGEAGGVCRDGLASAVGKEIKLYLLLDGGW